MPSPNSSSEALMNGQTGLDSHEDLPKVNYEEIFTEAELQRIDEEFGHVKNACYLDHTGATLYAKSQIDSFHSELQSNLFSNPHSRNPSSSITTDAIDYIRLRILEHFGTTGEDYSVIFTSGATSAMKLLAESFRFNGGLFGYLEESHTSVVGMRELVGRNCGSPGEKGSSSRVYCLAKTTLEQLMDSREKDEWASVPRHGGPAETLINEEDRNALIAYPAQCNFSGYKYPLDWIEGIQNGQLSPISNSTDFYLENTERLLEQHRFRESGLKTEEETMEKVNNVWGSGGDANEEETSKSWARSLNENAELRINKWFVFLDAASYVGTNALDLSLHPADFLALSFYKMFGFPTGLGALIVRNQSASVLDKCYFGGGTVNITLPSKNFHVKRNKLHERFEDGTISFLSILALQHGFDTMTRLGRSLETISERVFRLAQYFYKCLSSMKYRNGQPVARIYSDTTYESPRTQGAVVTFNLARQDGTTIGYSEMEQIAYLHDVHLRYGCFCNPGACRRLLGHQPDDILKHYEAGHVCGDMRDLINGEPTGAIRVSFGYMTRRRDVDFLLRLIHRCWILPFQVDLDGERDNLICVKNAAGGWLHRPDLLLSPAEQTELREERGRKLLRIFIYPIKSCAPFEVSKTWAVGARGLFYDREWLIMNSLGVPLTQKREPKLCQLKPSIDISNRSLILSMKGYPSMKVPLEIPRHQTQGKLEKAELCNSKVCGDTITGINCGEEISNWLSMVLEKPGIKLIRMLPELRRTPRNASDEISLANYSQFLLLSTGSLRHLATEILDRKGIHFAESSDEDEDTNDVKPPSHGQADSKFTEPTHESLSQFRSPVHDDASTDYDRIIRKSMANLVSRFRPNFLISEPTPYEEENWDEISIGNMRFKSGGRCMRCATICMDPKTGHRSSEPLLTLSAIRQGQPTFGIHLYAQTSSGISSSSDDDVGAMSSDARDRLNIDTVHVGSLVEGKVPKAVTSSNNERKHGSRNIYENSGARRRVTDGSKISHVSGCEPKAKEPTVVKMQKLLDFID